MPLTDRVLATEGRWLMGSFIPGELLRHLPHHLATVAPDDADELVSTIRARAAALVDADDGAVPDAAARGMQVMCAVVLAAHESLEPRLGSERAILLLRHVFGEVLQRSMQAVTHVLTARKDPLGALDSAMRQSSKMYGSSFEFAFERPSDDRFEMRVERCYFADWFERHGAVEVTTVLCAWDANWMRAIDTPVTGLSAERSSLISLGSDACRFTVTATDDPTVSYRDVLDDR